MEVQKERGKEENSCQKQRYEEGKDGRKYIWGNRVKEKLMNEIKWGKTEGKEERQNLKK